MASLDVIGAIELTGSAAFVIGSLALAVPGRMWAKAQLVIGLAAWFALLAALTGAGLFEPQGGLGTPGLGAAVMLTGIVVVGFVLASPERRALVSALPVQALIGVHWIRILGVDFLLLQAAGRLPAPFAPSAGWGDIAIGATALPLAWALARNVAGARPAAIAWSLLGMLDLVAAIALGVASAPDSPLRLFAGPPDSSPMATLPWILVPAFLVPLLFLLHFVALGRLWRATTGSAAPRREAALRAS